MTYQLFHLPKESLIGGAAIKPSFKVSFFLTGTTTPTPVYTTSALSVAHTQPVQADSGGVLATVYLDPSIVYKASVYDQNDVLQYTVDPVNDAVVSQAIIGISLWPRTAAEISAGVTPTNYAYQPYTPERYGAVGDGSTNDTVAVQAAFSAVPEHETVRLSRNYAIKNSGCTITDKSNICVVGPGMMKLSGADVDAVLIKLVGTCDNVNIRGVRFEGAGNSGATYFQYGVYSNSGQTLSGIMVEGCTFKNLNAAISFNAASSGTYNKCYAIGNTIEDMVGTEGGQGYGVHVAGAKDCVISSNIIRRCQRHSVYAALASTTAGSDFGVSIHDNVIRDHRSVGNGPARAAIYCVRGYGYSVKNNKLIDYYDGAIAVQHDTAYPASAGDSVIEGNTLIGRKNAVPSIWVGEQDDPSTNRTYNVRVANNFFRSDFSVNASANEISVYNGLGVDVVDNHIYLANLTNAAHRPIIVGEFAATGSLDMDNVRVLRNTVNGSLSGSGYLPIRLVYVATDAATIPGGNACVVRIADNEVDPLLLNVTAEFQSTQTNYKCVVKDQWGGITGVYTAGATAPSVYGGVTHLTVTNSGATNLATLADPVPGQRITLTFTDANTTVKHSTGNMRLIGGADITSAARKTLMLEYSPSYTQWLEVAVAANT